MAKHSDKMDVKTSHAAEKQSNLPAMFGSRDPFLRLREDVDRVFDGFLRGWPAMRGFDLGLPAGLSDDGLTPVADVSETDKRYEIVVELPGLDDKDVEVTLRDDLLTISGEKKTEREEKKKGYHLSERSYGSFQRSFRLPDDVQADKIEAEMQKGVMSISLPRSPSAKPKQRKIAISAKK